MIGAKGFSVPIKRSGRIKIVLWIILVLGLVGASVHFLQDEHMLTRLDMMLKRTGENLWVLYLAIPIRPALGIPNCPLLIVGGGVVSIVHGAATAACVAVLALITNVLWSYWIAAYPLRSFLSRTIAGHPKGRFLTEIDEVDVFRITILLHVTPGVPLFIQTYYPGIHRMPYWKYLLVAVPVQSCYTALIVLSSGEILDVVPGGLTMIILMGLTAFFLIKKLPDSCSVS